MFDRLLEGALEAYMPRIAKMKEERAKELASMKEKVRTSPEEVEAWFDRELEKLGTMDVKKLMQEEKEECDGRDLNPGYQIGNRKRAR